MPRRILLACFLAYTSQFHTWPVLAQDVSFGNEFSLSSVRFFHRFTKNDQHEYTPASQRDLTAWTDMVTILVYRKANDDKKLAAIAESAREKYKAVGRVLRAETVLNADSKSTEHLTVVVVGTPMYLEAVFARFRMQEGIGTAAIYCHRIYGDKVGDQMSAWLRKHGVATENSLLAWSQMPKLSELKK